MSSTQQQVHSQRGMHLLRKRVVCYYDARNVACTYYLREDGAAAAAGAPQGGQRARNATDITSKLNTLTRTYSLYVYTLLIRTIDSVEPYVIIAMKSRPHLY